MTTKLSVALWKGGNGCVKKKREKENEFSHFSFPVFEWTTEVGNEASHFLTSTFNQTAP